MYLFGHHPIYFLYIPSYLYFCQPLQELCHHIWNAWSSLKNKCNIRTHVDSNTQICWIPRNVWIEIFFTQRLYNILWFQYMHELTMFIQYWNWYMYLSKPLHKWDYKINIEKRSNSNLHVSFFSFTAKHSIHWKWNMNLRASFWGEIHSK